MSMIKMTVEQCMDLGLWNKYCEWSETSLYAINEGLIDYNVEIEFDSEFKKEDQEEETKLIYSMKYYDADNENTSILSVNIDKENYQEDLIEQITKILEDGNIIKSIILANDDEE